MNNAALALALLLVTSLPASAQQWAPPTAPQKPTQQEPPPPPPKKPVVAMDSHKRLKAVYRGPLFMVSHPLQAFHRVTFPIQHPLKTGQWMEKSGFNGLLGGLGAAGNLGTTAIVAGKKF